MVILTCFIYLCKYLNALHASPITQKNALYASPITQKKTQMCTHLWKKNVTYDWLKSTGKSL